MLRKLTQGMRTRWWHTCPWILLLNVLFGQVGEGGEIRRVEAGRFQLSTDLPAEQVPGWLQRMERVVDLSEAYWCRKLPGKIHCYLVDDLSQWSACDLPAEFAPRVLRRLSGGTDLQRPAAGSRMASQAVIYATTDPGVVEHEVVHAYCFQAFGRGGPDWYREGMAELFAQQVDREHDLGRGETLERLRRSDAIQLASILRNESHRQLRDAILTGQPARRVASNLLGDTVGTPAFMPAASVADANDGEANSGEAISDEIEARLDQPPREAVWTESDERRLDASKEVYAQSWALCHLLYHRREYRERFRLLGKHLLNGAPVKFEHAFEPRLREIEFELRQFAEHARPGYRPEWCGWEWVSNPRGMAVGETLGIRIHARRGYQAARIVVEPGQEYEISGEGQWGVGAREADVDADGHPDGRGCLVGSLLRDTELSPAFRIGQRQIVNVQQDGQIYLRCQDALHELADNRGSILVRITRQR